MAKISKSLSNLTKLVEQEGATEELSKRYNELKQQKTVALADLEKLRTQRLPNKIGLPESKIKWAFCW